MVTDLISEVVFKVSRIKIAFAIFIDGIFVLPSLALLFWFLKDPSAWLTLELSTILTLVLVFFSAIFLITYFGSELYAHLKIYLSHNNDKLIIRGDGFFYNQFSEDFINWSEVEEIERFKRGYVPVSVKFKNPENYAFIPLKHGS